ncbi:MAG: Rossmann-like and DUF2520 domain-containing protein [Candidatus Aminicenantaceae bacterium]
MIDTAIIGAGRLGTSLGYALSKKGYRIKAVSCKRLSSARQSLQIIGEGKAFTDNTQAAKEGELLFLCLPDSEIAKAAEELAVSTLPWRKKTVFHCSGLLPAGVLKPLKTKGALTASLHPVQSFSQKKGDLKQFEGIYFSLEGDKGALDLAQKIVDHFGGTSIFIKGKDKPLYHLACSIASNFSVVLLNVAVSLLKDIGLEEDKALKVIMPLIKRTQQNIEEVGIKSALTGPIIRGDEKPLEEHLKALKRYPAYREIFLQLTAQALEIAKIKNLPPEKIKTLKSLLEAK